MTVVINHRYFLENRASWHRFYATIIGRERVPWRRARKNSMPSSNRGVRISMKTNESAGVGYKALPILLIACICLASCKMLNQTVSRDTFVKDYSKIESTWEITPFQDSLMRDIGCLS